MNLIKQENEKLKNEIQKIEDIKKRISEEFTELNRKNELFESNMTILNQRELELNKKENEINLIINNYRQLLGSRFYQMNVTSNDNNSKYNYYFNRIENIISFKIISYSIPQPRYNIDSNNNTLLYKINDEDKEIKIDNGKYTIENLIEKLNNNDDLKISLNLNQKISITSESKFELKEGNLPNSVLGIKTNDEVIQNDNEFCLVGTNTWDLRLPDKLFLYITNINSEPISILYFNGNSETQIQFEDPIELTQLDIELKDEFGNLYDFNNLSHSINIQFELINQFDYSLVKNLNTAELIE